MKNPLQNDIQDSIPKFNSLWPQNQTQDTSKTLPRRPQDAPRAPRRPQVDPKTLPRRVKILSRRPQDGSKRPKTPQNASKTPSRGPKTPPKRLQDASRPRFRAIFVGPFLIGFGLIFDQFFIDFFIASPSLRYLITCVLGAVAGMQLRCALDKRF